MREEKGTTMEMDELDSRSFIDPLPVKQRKSEERSKKVYPPECLLRRGQGASGESEEKGVWVKPSKNMAKPRGRERTLEVDPEIRPCMREDEHPERASLPMPGPKVSTD